MRKLLIVFVGLLTSSSIFSEDFVLSKTGYAFTGDGDLSGINFEFEYVSYLSQSISLGGGISSVNFPYRQQDEAIISNDYIYFSNSKSIFASLYFDLYKKERSTFKIGVKPGLKYWRNTNITGPSTEYSTIVPESSTYQDQLYTFSYSLNVNYQYRIKDNWGLQVSGEIGNDLNGSNVIYLNIGTFFKL
jgi:hypothetical protein